jgi:hypothetical protein
MGVRPISSEGRPRSSASDDAGPVERSWLEIGLGKSITVQQGLINLDAWLYDGSSRIREMVSRVTHLGATKLSPLTMS